MSDAFIWGMICLCLGAIIGFFFGAICAQAKYRDDKWDK